MGAATATLVMEKPRAVTAASTRGTKRVELDLKFMEVLRVGWLVGRLSDEVAGQNAFAHWVATKPQTVQGDWPRPGQLVRAGDLVWGGLNVEQFEQQRRLRGPARSPGNDIVRSSERPPQAGRLRRPGRGWRESPLGARRQGGDGRLERFGSFCCRGEQRREPCSAFMR